MMTRWVLRLLLPVGLIALLLVGGALAVAGAVPPGPQFAYLTDCQGWENIALADLRYGLQRPLTCDSGGKTQMTWSPDGRYLAYFNNGAALFSLVVRDMEADNSQFYTFDSTRYYVNSQQPLTWSPDGNRIAFVSTTAGDPVQKLFTIDLVTGALTQVTPGERDATQPQWSPLDADVLFFQWGDTLYAAHPNGDIPPVAVAEHIRYLWTVDGVQVGYDYGRPTIQITETDGTTREITLPGDIRLNELTASPDGEQVAVVVAGASGLAIDRINTLTGRADAVVSSLFYIGQVAWSPDGDWLAYVETDSRNGGDNIALYHLPSGRNFSFIVTPRRDWSPVWRPAG
jgi:Tol biopolymer transport system component